MAKRGRPRIPVEQNILRGSYRKDRHGPRPTEAVTPSVVEQFLEECASIADPSEGRTPRDVARKRLRFLGPITPALRKPAAVRELFAEFAAEVPHGWLHREYEDILAEQDQ